jgi:AcrR family transcriptional regulator
MSTVAKADVREKLVETAARLFYAQGYQATGINQIIDEASVCKASFYNHFKTKEDLLVAWLERTHNEAMAQIRQRMTGKTSPREQLREFFNFQEERLCGSGFRGCPFLNTLAEAPEAESKVREVMRWHPAASRQMMEEFVARATRSRKLAGGDVQRLVDDLEIVINGGLVAARTRGDVRQLRHAQDLAERILGLV